MTPWPGSAPPRTASGSWRRSVPASSVYEPESNIVCFRYGTADQGVIRERMMEEGSFRLSSTDLGGSRYPRITVIAPATDERTLTSLLDHIAEIG